MLNSNVRMKIGTEGYLQGYMFKTPTEKEGFWNPFRSKRKKGPNLEQRGRGARGYIFEGPAVSSRRMI